MRVLGVTFRYPPHSRVGAWLQTHNVLSALAARGHDVRVKTLEAGVNHTLDGVQVSPVDIWRKEPFTVGEIEADLVISHYGDNVSKVNLLAKQCGVPHVMMVHGEVGKKPVTDLAVFNSFSLQKSGEKWRLPSTVCRPSLNPSQHATRRGVAVGIVNTSEAKGGGVFGRIADVMPDHRFFACQGHHGEQLRFSQRNVEQVAATANMKRHVWPNIRVLLMPSEKETWGMVGLEAMCSGIPVIAHPTPGLRESLGEAGIFVDRDDIDGWVEQISRLDSTMEYERASLAARRRADEVARFDDLDRLVQRIGAMA